MSKKKSTVDELKEVEEQLKQKPRKIFKAIPIRIDGNTALMLGSGATARSHNLNEVIRLVQQGSSDEQIVEALELYFKPVTILEYIRIARKHLKEMKANE